MCWLMTEKDLDRDTKTRAHKFIRRRLVGRAGSTVTVLVQSCHAGWTRGVSHWSEDRRCLSEERAKARDQRDKEMLKRKEEVHLPQDTRRDTQACWNTSAPPEYSNSNLSHIAAMVLPKCLVLAHHSPLSLYTIASPHHWNFLELCLMCPPYLQPSLLASSLLPLRNSLRTPASD